MKKKTLFFTCLLFGGVLFAGVSFYLGLWGGSKDYTKEAPKQKVVSEGGKTAVPPLAPTPAEPLVNKATTPSVENTLLLNLVVAESDPLGIATLSPHAAELKGSGVKTLAIPEIGSFALYWLPSEKAIDRLMVLLPDKGETAYDEMVAELAMAKKNGYGLVALQWHNVTPPVNLTPGEIYRAVSSLSDWLEREEKSTPRVRVLSGFDRGSVIAYEVLSLDRAARRLFTGSVHHSGGIPVDAVIDPGTSTRPNAFFVSMIVGQAKSDLYSGLRSYMYCGRQDEVRGAKGCEEMSYAQSLLVKYGAKVDGFVLSETLGARGLRTDEILRQGLTDWFLKL